MHMHLVCLHSHVHISHAPHTTVFTPCTHTPIHSAPLIQRISIVHQSDKLESEVYIYMTYTYTCVLYMYIYAHTYAPMYCKPTLDEKLKTVDFYSITS